MRWQRNKQVVGLVNIHSRTFVRQPFPSSLHERPLRRLTHDAPAANTQYLLTQSNLVVDPPIYLLEELFGALDACGLLPRLIQIEFFRKL